MEFIGRGSISCLSDFLSGKVLFFTQNGNMLRFKNIFDSILNGKSVFFYKEIHPNPKKEDIQTAQNTLKEKFDTIIAFGGGSVIDFAKAFKYYSKLDIPLIAIPTTAGTGSEVTQFAVVYDNGEKISLDDASLLPNVAIVDSQFVENAPQYLKACCAMDAYCQAIESFWAKKATEESKKYALQAVELCREYLVKAVTSNNAEANEKMALAAHLAGKAINISRTTAAHALSYKITSKYRIPHGHAVALSITGLFLANFNDILNIDVLLSTLKLKKSDIRDYFHSLMQDIGLEDDLKKLDVTDVDEIVDSVNIERLKNNPKDLNRKDLIGVLNSEEMI